METIQKAKRKIFLKEYFHNLEAIGNYILLKLCQLYLPK